jgi:aryl carrier-like protein
MDAQSRPFAPAITPMQKRLAPIWAEVLELPEVSITESIFELGADSLLIFRIAAKAQREGLAVNASMIFQQRTIAAICDSLERGTAKAPARIGVRIAAAERDKYRLTNHKVDA